MRLILAGVLALPMFAQGPFTEAVTAAYERVKLNLVETAVAMPDESRTQEIQNELARLLFAA